jgi:hypothetical protein
MGGNPYAGRGLLDGTAFGALKPWEQDTLKGYWEEAQKAQAEGNQKELDRIRQKTFDYLVEIGAKPEPEKKELGVSGLAPVGYVEGDGVQTPGEGAKKLKEVYGGDNWGGFFQGLSDWIMGKSNPDRREILEGTERDLAESSQPGKGSVEDRAPEAEGPDFHREFTDAYLESRRKAMAGAEVNPNPNDVRGAPVGSPPTDYTAPVEQYEEGHVPQEEYDIDDRPREYDLKPEEEF